jgi:hypothetical protein
MVSCHCLLHYNILCTKGLKFSYHRSKVWPSRHLYIVLFSEVTLPCVSKLMEWFIDINTLLIVTDCWYLLCFLICWIKTRTKILSIIWETKL